VWWWFTRDAERAEVEKFRLTLWLPPKGAEIPANSPWSAESEKSAFGALKAGLNAK